MKKFCRICSLLIMVVFAMSINSTSVKVSSKSKTIVEKRMDEIVKKYPNHSFFKESVRFVTYKLGNTYIHHAGGCNGFIAYVTRKIFHKAYRFGTKDYKKIGSASANSDTKMRKLFKKAKCGDVIVWTQKGDSTHYAIFLNNSNDGVYVYEANFGKYNEVWFNHFWSWKVMKDWPGRGADKVSVFRSKNYSAVNNKKAAINYKVGKVITIDENSNLKVLVLDNSINNGSVLLLDSVEKGVSIPYSINRTDEDWPWCWHKKKCESCDVNSNAFYKVIKCGKVKANVVGKRKVKINWNKMENITGYNVYRSTSKDSGYKKIKSCKGMNNTSYVDTAIMSGETYYYKVQGYKRLKGEKYFSNFSRIVSVEIPDNG